MKTETLLKTALMLLVVCLTIVVTSWLSSEATVARANGGGGSAAGNWILVTTTLQNSEGLLYMFNAEREVLLVYAFYRRTGTSRGATRYRGDLEFLAGRHCRWDALYSGLTPFPYELKNRRLPKDLPTPAQVKRLFEKRAERE
jgi:hypothetical protein